MDPQEGDIATGPNGQTAVYRGGQWVVQAQSQGAVPGFVPFAGPAEQRAEASAQRADQRESRMVAADERRVDIDARTSERQGNQSETDLRKEFLQRQPVAEFPVIAKAYRDINATATNASAAGDISLLIAYMKMLDPDSVVRETEFATAQNAASVPDRIRNLYNNALSGERLNADQRQDFINQANSLYQGSLGAYNEEAQRYRGLADSYGYMPDNVALPVTPDADPSMPKVSAAVKAGTDGVMDSPEVIERNGQKFYAIGRGGQGAPANINSQFGQDGEITDAEMTSAGYQYDQESGLWLTPANPITLSPTAGSPSGGGIEGLIAGKGRQDTAAGQRSAQGEGFGRKLDAFGRGAADTMTFGLADEIVAGANTILPLDRGSQSIWTNNAGDAYSHNLAMQRGIDRADGQDVPVSRLSGQVVGGIATPGAASAGGLIARAPSVAQAVGRGAMVGGVAGAAYGAGSAEGGLADRVQGAQQGAMTGAVAGGVLGGGGRVVGNAVSGATSRAMTSPRAQAVQILDNNGVFMTPGQRMGGIVGNIEDLAQRAPIIGPAIRGARQRGVESLNRAVGNRALDPIGEGVPANIAAGGDMVGHVQQRLGAEFDRAYSLVPEINVNDPQLLQGLTRIGQSKADLPPAMQQQFDSIISERLSRLQGAATGQAVGSVRSELNALAGGYLKSQDPSQQALGRMIAELGEELDGAISRASPEAGEILGRARTGYADYIRLERASTAAGGQPFSPGQLTGAVRASDGSVRRGAVGRGEAQMQDLSGAAQTIMPGRFGNPGTADAVGLGGLGVGMVTEPLTTTAIAGGLAVGATPYMLMGRKAVERLPANASRQEVEAVLGELDQLARQDSNVIVLRDEIARRFGQAVPVAAQQSAGEPPRLMTGTSGR